MVADWQESFRAESPELLTPLLDKNDDGAASASKSKSAPKKRETDRQSFADDERCGHTIAAPGICSR